jgi:deoxyribonuclease V
VSGSGEIGRWIPVQTSDRVRPPVSRNSEPATVGHMMMCLDVHYESHAVVTAGLGFSHWEDASSVLEVVVRTESAPAVYEPGQFYKRELPHLTALIARVHSRVTINALIVDGHVWLGPGRPGLGAHLYGALEDPIAVIGVAKSAFHEGVAIPVVRGASRAPLFVTARGIDPAHAAELVRTMHGPHRLPTLIKRVDSLARGHEPADPLKSARMVD